MTLRGGRSRAGFYRSPQSCKAQRFARRTYSDRTTYAHALISERKWCRFPAIAPA